MSRSGVMKPGTSALVESASSRSTPSSPSRAKARRSVSRPSSGSWSILKSPVCSTRPAGGADRHRERVRDRVVDREELAVERPELLALALPHLERVRLDAVLLQLGLDHGQRQPRADQRDVGLLAQQVGHGADVVLVAVGQHDGRRRRRAGPGCSRSRAGSGRRRAGSPRGTARRSRRPAAGRRTRRRSCCGRSRRARRARRCAGRPPAARAAAPSSGCGWLIAEPQSRGPSRRRGHLGRPSRPPAAAARSRSGITPSSCSAALAMIAPCDDRSMIARTDGMQPAVDAERRRSGRRGRRPRPSRRSRRRATWPTTLTTPTPPWVSQARFSASSPE